VLVVLVTSFLSAIGLGLALIVMMDGLATGNLRGSVAMLYAADTAIELTARELALEDWDRALGGQARSAFVDGAPGPRAIPGGVLDLTEATNLLNCGQSAGCSDWQMNRSTPERPWGDNNARWQLFAHGPFASLAPAARPALCYLAVWIADDGREEDGDPLSDSPQEDAPGHGVLRIRAEAFGPTGSRRALEAELERFCGPGGPGECLPRIRVQSWQEVRQFVP
jgi:hypothetical protein